MGGCTYVALCRGVTVWEGTGRKQGWWVYCMSQGTTGEWETGKPLGAGSQREESHP